LIGGAGLGRIFLFFEALAAENVFGIFWLDRRAAFLAALLAGNVKGLLERMLDVLFFATDRTATGCILQPFFSEKFLLAGTPDEGRAAVLAGDLLVGVAHSDIISYLLIDCQLKGLDVNAEAPNYKSQIPNKLQYSKFEFSKFGTSDLFVIWCLLFVICACYSRTMVQSFLHIFSNLEDGGAVVSLLQDKYQCATPPVVLNDVDLNVKELRDELADIAKRPLVGGGINIIILRAESISKEVANTLLKALEEPPPYVMFHLTTNNEHRVLQTIVSRCRRERVTSYKLQVTSDGGEAGADEGWRAKSLAVRLGWAEEMAVDKEASSKLILMARAARQRGEWPLARRLLEIYTAFEKGGINRRLMLENFVLDSFDP